MLTRRAPAISTSEITDRRVYLNRREFFRAATAAGMAGGTAMLGARAAFAAGLPAGHGPKLDGVQKSRYSITDPPTPWDKITSYNNFYEFAGNDDKDVPSELAPQNLITKPWSITVDGECATPRDYPLEEVLAGQTLEERIYRHRCVEGWSMVIPWVGFPLAELIKKCQPTSNAYFVAYESHYDPRRMPRSLRLPFDWPYTEGLRMDEAMHPLAILAVGLYGETLPHQDGAPIRLVVPWKYGFKSIKSIVRITFSERRPVGTYQAAEPRSYGFYANVNPNVDHRRWSQATERRLGEFFKRKTVMFNGYGDEVAKMYAGMDLKQYY